MSSLRKVEMFALSDYQQQASYQRIRNAIRQEAIENIRKAHPDFYRRLARKKLPREGVAHSEKNVHKWDGPAEGQKNTCTLNSSNEGYGNDSFVSIEISNTSKSSRLPKLISFTYQGACAKLKD